MKLKFMPLLLLLPALMMVLPGCTSGPSEADINATVEAKVEQAKASLVAPTAVPLPTYTPVPIPTPVPLPTYTPLPPLPTYTPLPTLTRLVIIKEVVVTATPTAKPTPTITPTPQPYTEVGGVLRSDTTWGLANSPYLVTEMVSIRQGITLTIEEGVEVRDASFNVHGILRVQGSETRLVYLRGFRNTHLIKGPGTNIDAEALVEVSFAKIEGFQIFYDESWGGSGGQFTLKVRDSVFKDIEAPSRLLANYHIIIERNRFENAAGFDLGGDWTGSFHDNCFVSKSGQSKPWFNIQYPRTPELIAIEYNAFVDAGTLAFKAGYAGGEFPLSVPAFISPNYYGTTDATIIDQMVSDSSDDLVLGFRIIVTPILETSPVAGCYSLPPTATPTPTVTPTPTPTSPMGN